MSGSAPARRVVLFRPYLAGSRRVVLFRLYFSLFTLTISQKLPLFILLYLLMINSCFNVLQTTVNLELCKIDHRLRANKLSLNYNKTNFMLLTSRKHNLTSFKVTINNHNISPKDNLKYLGVLLDNKLSWKPHVQKVKTQLSRACGILSKLKHYTTPPVLKVVYNSLIHPTLIAQFSTGDVLQMQPFSLSLSSKIKL